MVESCAKGRFVRTFVSCLCATSSTRAGQCRAIPTNWCGVWEKFLTKVVVSSGQSRYLWSDTFRKTPNFAAGEDARKLYSLIAPLQHEAFRVKPLQRWRTSTKSTFEEPVGILYIYIHIYLYIYIYIIYIHPFTMTVKVCFTMLAHQSSGS